MTTIALPDVIGDFHRAHVALRDHFADSRLPFTLDGRLVGDLGEVIAALAFNLELCAVRTPGVDAHTRSDPKQSVQIKATGKLSSGPAFTPGQGRADHLIFLRIDFERGLAQVAYNGPELRIRSLLPEQWAGTKVVPLARVREANCVVNAAERLPLVIAESPVPF